ncbi:MAG: protein kinase domain-containing protein [Ardenticatenaceae bacterium]
MNQCGVCQQSNRLQAKFCLNCGTRLRDTQGNLSSGVMLEGRYQIEQVLGSGGFGVAYQAKDWRLAGRACVVKEMRIPPGISQPKIDYLQHSFKREAQSLVDLNHPGHPNIPEIYDFFSTPNSNYFVMKYIEGQDLKRYLAQQAAPLPWEEALKIVLAVSDALLYMHARQPPVLHRDIKPANILIDQADQANRVWLIDFGLSKAQATTTSGNTNTLVAGTYGYAPPEQWLGKAVPASDIYALAATLHELLTARAPSKGAHFAALRQLVNVPAQLERLVAAALDLDLTQRPNALQWKQGLEALLAPKPIAPPFVFHDGQTANQPIELVPLSLSFWQEARDYLYNGPFEKWFTARNQPDLVNNVKYLIQQEPNRDIGLDRFLRLLDPNLPLPQVTFETHGTNFGQIDPSASPPSPALVKIINQGPSGFYGTCQLAEAWLHLDLQKFALRPNQTLDIKLTVQPNQLQWNHSYTNQLLIRSHSIENTINFLLHTPSRLQSRQNIMKIMGLSGGLPGVIWGAGLGTLFGIIIWNGLTNLFFYVFNDDSTLSTLLTPDPKFMGLGAIVGFITWFAIFFINRDKTSIIFGWVNYLLAGAIVGGIGADVAFLLALVINESNKPGSIANFADPYPLIPYYIFAIACIFGMGAVIGLIWGIALSTIRLLMWFVVNLLYPARHPNNS